MRSGLRWIALGTAGVVAALALSYAVGWLRPAVPLAVAPSVRADALRGR